jgi:signal transduction histidine kinase
MTVPLRQRLLLTVIPPLVLLAAVGGAAAWLIHRLGNLSEAILHENYDSVIFMVRLNEALERIDSSFQFALAGEPTSPDQYQDYWKTYRINLEREQKNITVPGEDQLVDELTRLTTIYQRLGEDFYRRPGEAVAEQKRDYFGQGGLLDTFRHIKDVSGRILTLNHDTMMQESENARQTARASLIWFGAGFLGAAAVAGLLSWHTSRAILRPIRAVTQSAIAIGAGNLDQVVPVMSRDDLGQLAEAFNTMARQMRQYRQSDYARLLRAQRTSQATIDSFPDPVLVVDSEGRVEMANPAAQRRLGLGKLKPGQPSLVPWQPPEILRQPLLEALRDQRPYDPEDFEKAFAIWADGQDHFFLPCVLPIKDPYGNTLGAAVLLQDVTRFRLLDEAKSDLVATVSHELKTPLTSLRLALHVLLEETVGPLSAKQTELLLDARDNAERLLSRINHLLDLTRLEKGREQLDFRAERPATLLQEAADTIRPRAEDKGVTIHIDAPPHLPSVSVDAQRIGYALSNLLENALTYTERGGRISLTASASPNKVVLEIADTGQGIPPEFQPHIFDKFFRVPGQSRGEGTGLGLAIAREIITVHGGTISCASRPGLGTSFHITLPARKDEA